MREITPASNVSGGRPRHPSGGMIAVNSCSCVPVLRHAKNTAAHELFPLERISSRIPTRRPAGQSTNPNAPRDFAPAENGRVGVGFLMVTRYVARRQSLRRRDRKPRRHVRLVAPRKDRWPRAPAMLPARCCHCRRLRYSGGAQVRAAPFAGKAPNVQDPSIRFHPRILGQVLSRKRECFTSPGLEVPRVSELCPFAAP